MTMYMHEPRSSRFGINHRSVLLRADGSESPVIIINISRIGFRLKTTETLTSGEIVNIRGEAGDVPAQIRWALGNSAGGVFLRPEETAS